MNNASTLEDAESLILMTLLMHVLVFRCPKLPNLVRKRIICEALLGRRFGTDFGSHLVAFWSHFGIRNRSKKASESTSIFGAILEAPRGGLGGDPGQNG